MGKHLFWGLTAIICSAILAGTGLAIEGRLNNVSALNAMAPPRVGSGHATKVTVTTSQATQITADTVVCFICTGTTGGAYYELGDGSGATADSNSWWVPDEYEKCLRSGATGDSDYLSIVDVGAAGGTCWIQESE